MSILEDFARGFLTTYQGDMLKKQQREEERLERKRLTNERLAEEARRRKLDQMDRRQARDEELAAARQGEGYNPETGMVEWIDGNGNPGSRKATMAEIAAYRASLDQAEADREKTQSAIDLNRARAENARAAANRPRGSGGEREPKPPSPAKKEVALAAIGLTSDPPSGSVEEAVVLEQMSGQISPQEARDRLTVLRRQRNTLQAKQDAITNRLPQGSTNGS